MKTFYILVPTQKVASPLKIYQAEYYLIKHDNWCYYKGVKLLLRTNRWRKSKRSDINNLLILLIRLVLRVSSSYTSTLGPVLQTRRKNVDIFYSKLRKKITP